MLTTLAVVAVVLLCAAYLTSSKDPLDISVVRSFIKILLKFLPGYTAPLRCDSSGVFHFDEIRLEGEFALSPVDYELFIQAVGSVGPFLLTAKTTPLAIQILADPRCPIKPLGAVNTKNKIRVLRTVQIDERLRYVARFGMPGQRKKRGVEFAVTIDFYQGDELVMESELWFLAFLPASFKPAYAGAVEKRVETAGESVGQLSLRASQPRLWAASCKDYNPIHISSLAARLFGQRSIIAHGNHVAALVVEELGLTPVLMEPEFVRPVNLPGMYDIVKHDEEHYSVQKAGKTYLTLAVNV